MPRRHTDRPGKFIDSEGSAATIATCDDQRALQAGQRCIHCLNQERLPRSAQCRGVEFPRGDQPVDERTASQRADDDCMHRHFVGVAMNERTPAGHTFNVGRQVTDGNRHHFVVAGGRDNRDVAVLGKIVQVRITGDAVLGTLAVPKPCQERDTCTACVTRRIISRICAKTGSALLDRSHPRPDKTTCRFTTLTVDLNPASGNP